MSKANLKEEDFEWAGVHPFSYHPFVFELVPDLNDKITLDCGCGKGIYGYLIRTTRPIGKGKIIGLDVNPKRLAFVKKFKVYDRLIKGSITKLPFRDKSIDFTICSEVIEHLKKSDGEKFIKEVERVMKPGGRVIITTPNIKIDTCLGDVDDHESLWNVTDFRNHGYKVRGVGLRISHSFNKWYTKPTLALSHTFTFLGYLVPEVAGYLIAYKDFE